MQCTDGISEGICKDIVIDVEACGDPIAVVVSNGGTIVSNMESSRLPLGGMELIGEFMSMFMDAPGEQGGIE